MTALGRSHLWATMAQGIVTEVYWPAVDQPQVKDLGFLIGGPGWWQEVKRVDRYTLSTPEAGLMLPTVVHAGVGRDYRLTLRPVVDPARDALLIDYELTGAGVRLYPLLTPHLGTSQITPEPQWQALGADNTAWAGEDLALFASDGSRFVCLLAQPGFTRAGAGYVGDTDGWTDFTRNGSMTLTYDQAGPGVVALTGELAAGSGLLALGFGDSQDSARAAAQASLAAGYDATADAFTWGWRAWTAGLTLPGLAQLAAAPPGLAGALRDSAVVLRSHADHTVDGAYVAGLAIPWGNYANDPGGYHMVWCRDGGETALALAVIGHADDAADTLGYLIGRQSQDGSWPRCFYVSRVAAPFDPQAAVQLDEVAFPLLLSGKLAELGVALPEGTDNAIIKAARYLAQNGPVSGQDVDRWEENPGASPFTIGLEIVALLVAATRLSGPDQALALALADNWNERLEEFTYVSGDELDQAFGTGGHYVRIGRPGGGRITLANQPQDTSPVDAAALVGLEFAYLPRLGLRDAADKRITDTLAIVEAMLAADTPSGRAYHRYDIDGYGEWLDGTGWPVRKFGIGRPWPLLAGERGHLDLLSGGDASVQLRAMLAMRGRGGLLPEQVWDAGSLPWQNLRPGQPTGSAMPLAWAHSELVKLAVAVATGKPVELLALVADRYHAAVPASPSWFWRDASPVLALPAGRSLVVAESRPFTLHYGFNDWSPVTISERDAEPLGLGLFGVTLTPADLDGRASLQFVRRYPDGTWEPSTRHDVALGAAGPATVRLSQAHLGRLAASR
jgi:glucoamylase